MRKDSFIPLFVTNLFGTMNDNFLKTLASFIVIGWLQDASLRPVFMGVTAGALVLPYILCSPLADRLTVVFPKRRILQLAKWAEIPIVGIGAPLANVEERIMPESITKEVEIEDLWGKAQFLKDIANHHDIFYFGYLKRVLNEKGQ